MYLQIVVVNSPSNVIVTVMCNEAYALCAVVASLNTWPNSQSQRIIIKVVDAQ